VALLDLTNVASDTKRSYGHEILRGRPNLGDEEGMALSEAPLARLIISKGYLEQSRRDKKRGILCSLLGNGQFKDGDAKAIRELDALSLVLKEESANPGSHINESARGAFFGCAHQHLVVQLSTDLGINLRTWAPEGIGKNPQLAAKLSAMQSSIEAKKAIDLALPKQQQQQRLSAT
jgi:hypothetical protein